MAIEINKTNVMISIRLLLLLFLFSNDSKLSWVFLSMTLNLLVFLQNPTGGSESDIGLTSENLLVFSPL